MAAPSTPGMPHTLPTDLSTLRPSTPEPGLVIIMLDRLEPFNTLSADLQRELHAVLDASAADLSVRVMVVIGAGRGFCTGLDLTDFDMSGPGSAKHTPQSGMAVQVRLAALVSKPPAQPQVVIATPGLVRERQLRILPRYRTTATPIRPETGPTTTGALSEEGTPCAA